MTPRQLRKEGAELAQWFADKQITPHDAIIIFALVLQIELKANPLDSYERSGILGLVEKVLRNSGFSQN